MSAAAPPDATAAGGVFLSYGHVDRQAADLLYRHLQTHGVAVWYDAFIAPGADWRDAIVEHLGQARVMVVLLSEAALRSDQIKKELAVADQENVPLLTARLENVKPRDAFAYELARGNWFDIFPDPDRRLADLAALLGELIHDPGRIRQTLESSVHARRERRLREAWGRFGFLRQASVVAGLVACVSLVVWWLYEQRAAPVDQLTAGGVSPLLVYAFVFVAVTVGSPLIVVSLLRGGVSAAEMPLLVTAAVNSALLSLLGVAIIRDIRLGVRRILRR